MENKKEKLPSININWFPGHMAKTQREITEDLKLIDVVIELLDARIPYSSRNPVINKIINGKKKIILLNKSDLSDPEINNLWREKLSKEAPTILTDSNSGRGVDKVTKQIDALMEEELKKQAARGRINKTIRVMILGIPNVGKSSFINRITKKQSLEVGNKPGVTRKKQWIRIGKNQELMDTPGVLWPKFESEEVSLNLAFTGTIKDDILERTEIAYELLKKLHKDYKKELYERYKISETDEKEVLESANPMYTLMKIIGRKRGALVSGGEVDDEKVARIILEDFRSGKIGKISLEQPK
jgi:ribosome biogenesis GTPase A